MIKHTHVFKAVLTPKEYLFYKDLSLEELTKNSGSGMTCPYPNCPHPSFQAKNGSQTVKCPSCSGLICVSCKEKYDDCLCEDKIIEKVEKKEFQLYEIAKPLKNETTFHISVKLGSGSLTLEVYNSYTIDECKKIIANSIMKPKEYIAVVFSGKKLDENLRIGDLHLGKESTLNILITVDQEDQLREKRLSEKILIYKNDIEFVKNIQKKCPGPGCNHIANHGKDDNCHHITCVKCSFEWCYICSIRWNHDCAAKHHFCNETCGCIK